MFKTAQHMNWSHLLHWRDWPVLPYTAPRKGSSFRLPSFPKEAGLRSYIFQKLGDLICFLNGADGLHDFEGIPWVLEVTCETFLSQGSRGQRWSFSYTTMVLVWDSRHWILKAFLKTRLLNELYIQNTDVWVKKTRASNLHGLIKKKKH